MESILEAIGNTLISPGDTVVEYTGGSAVLRTRSFSSCARSAGD